MSDDNMSNTVQYISIIDNSSGARQRFNLSQYTSSSHNGGFSAQNGGANADQDTASEVLEKKLQRKLYGDDFDNSFQNIISGGVKKETVDEDTDGLEQIDIKFDSDSDLKEKDVRMNMNVLYAGSNSSYSGFEDDFWNESAWTIDTDYNLVGGRGEALKIYREFVAYVQNALQVKGGIPMSKLGGYYMKKAKKALEGEKDMSVLTKKAKEIFDKDKPNAKHEYDKFTKEIQDRKKNK
jgi:hypothetical protein